MCISPAGHVPKRQFHLVLFMVISLYVSRLIIQRSQGLNRTLLRREQRAFASTWL
ncbi:hypothetical protein CPB83DRAFT_865012, partial [Crepidotus variabilis]